MKTITTNVTDTNGFEIGSMVIYVEFNQDKPIVVDHKFVRFFATGKIGASLKTGVTTYEMASNEDARIWVDDECANLWED